MKSPPEHDPRAQGLAQFLERFALDERRAAAADVAPALGLSALESWRALESVCRDVALMIAAHPDRDQIICERDPPHPSYQGIMRKLKMRFRERRHHE